MAVYCQSYHSETPPPDQQNPRRDGSQQTHIVEGLTCRWRQISSSIGWHTLWCTKQHCGPPQSLSNSMQSKVWGQHGIQTSCWFNFSTSWCSDLPCEMNRVPYLNPGQFVVPQTKWFELPAVCLPAGRAYKKQARDSLSNRLKLGSGESSLSPHTIRGQWLEWVDRLYRPVYSGHPALLVLKWQISAVESI